MSPGGRAVGGCARAYGRASSTERPARRRPWTRVAIPRRSPAPARGRPAELPPADQRARSKTSSPPTDLFPSPFFPSSSPLLRRGRTGVQLKDKWRNLIKFQHLRRGEAESAPHRTGGRGPGPGAKRKNTDDGYANSSRRPPFTHCQHELSRIAFGIFNGSSDPPILA